MQNAKFHDSFFGCTFSSFSKTFPKLNFSDDKDQLKTPTVKI